MSYTQFVQELVKFPYATSFRTDLATLHTAVNTLREREGLYDPLPNISNVEIIDNEQARNAIIDLININLHGYGHLISDLFMIGKIDISLSRHGATAKRVSIDITLVHTADLVNNLHFIEMQAAMTSEQAHRSWT